MNQVEDLNRVIFDRPGSSLWKRLPRQRFSHWRIQRWSQINYFLF